jgi:3-hydroxyisobutyrate dehydrogenase
VTTVGVIGLGNMGSGMAQSLQRAGFEVIGTAASAATRARAAAAGLVTVDDAAAVARSAEFIVLSLPSPEAVSQVVEGPNGLKQCGRVGQLIIDTSTSDAPTTRRLAGTLSKAGIAFIDAPVSGAPAVARSGQLTVMIGGSNADVARADPVLSAFGATRIHAGPLGAGNIAKLANNLMAAAHFLVASEAVAFAKGAGLTPEAFLQVINASTGRSFITERVYPNWILNGRFDLGFTAKLMRKDVRLAGEQIERLRVDLPILTDVARQWLGSGEHIRDEEDVTRIVELLARRAGSNPPPP